MKQVLQHLRTGEIELAEVPCASASTGKLLVRSTRTLVSAGTERMLVDFGKAGWVSKALQQPEKVGLVLDKIKSDGLLPAIEAVRSKLDQPMPMGYCNVGRVAAVGENVGAFSVGDRVVSNGNHAEYVAVPRNLCARIPDAVPDEEAAFTVLGAIALQGVRLAAPTLGEMFVVTGLGLIGLITVQILRANGCRVLGIDPDPAKALLAKQFGAEIVAFDRGEDPLAVADGLTAGRGVDGVIITAATSSNEPMSQAARMCRKRGRIVLVGVVGLELDRADFYQKEISFQVSCSYGPGRYDPEYEEKGNDYPVGFVRWTEQRNFEAVLDMMRAGMLNVRPLISHRFSFEEAPAAYALLTSGSEPYIGIVLEYSTQQDNAPPVRTISLPRAMPTEIAKSAPGIAFIGAGNYASRVLIPAFVATGAKMVSVASGGGLSAALSGRKFGFQTVTTEVAQLFADPQVDLVVVATRHDTHARFVTQALSAGKHVFVEKPIATTLEDLDAICKGREAAMAAGRSNHIMVGFNRRFAPQIVRAKDLLGGLREPKCVLITVNAGAIPAAHWTQDQSVGGGRIIGEGCHFVDLARFLVGQKIVTSSVNALGTAAMMGDDKVSISLKFADGSIAAIHYFANGNAKYPKERVEVFCAGRILQIDNFRRMVGFGWPRFKKLNLWRQDKGQNACAAAFVSSVRGDGESPIPFDEIVEVGRVVIALGEAARG